MAKYQSLSLQPNYMPTRTCTRTSEPLTRTSHLTEGRHPSSIASENLLGILMRIRKKLKKPPVGTRKERDAQVKLEEFQAMKMPRIQIGEIGRMRESVWLFCIRKADCGVGAPSTLHSH